MMKRVLPCLLFMGAFVPVVVAGIGIGLVDDGLLETGEYEVSGELTNSDSLLVIGGGAYEILAYDESKIEVQYTSTPLQMNVGGILDIVLSDHSDLLYLGGITGEITIKKNATMTLKGGQINYIRSGQFVYDTPHITIECLPGWSWIYNSSNEIKGITGMWGNGITSFNIGFFDDNGTFGYNPTWENIKIVEVPEPTTLVLFGLGGFLIHRRRKK